MPKGKKKRVVPCCSVCGKAMPEAEVWRGRIVVCEKKSCRKDVRAFGKSNATPRYIGANEVRCGRPGCDNYVPEGYFQPNLQYTVCSESCYWRRSWEAETLTCAYPPCGKEFRGRSGYRRYCSKEHAKLHVQDQHLDSFCGGFRDLYQEYIDSASLSKRSMSTQRSGLALFFHFVNEHAITDLETVVPATITRFLKWGEETAKPSVWNAIWVISSFMDWMRGTGRRKGANPVITRYHRRPKAKRLPRPYTEEQMRYIWMLLEQRGTTVVRLAVAIAEETGIRISELANIRMADIDPKKQRLFVRLPNKTMVEAWVPFHNSTVKFLKVWLSERDPKLPHDFLLCCGQGKPYKKGRLHDAIARILCKTHRGHKYNDEGIDSWSTHRLRHLMATRLVAGGANAAAVMAIGRWASFSAMQGYSQVDDAVKARGYDEAMTKARKNREQPAKATSSFRKYVNQQSRLPKAS